jgi:hypothetical protein
VGGDAAQVMVGRDRELARVTGLLDDAKSKGRTIEDFRAISAKHNAPADIDGLLAWAVGSDQDGLNVVTV